MHTAIDRVLHFGRHAAFIGALAFTCSGLLACGDDGDVTNEQDARNAYLGLDKAVDRILRLGFDGFNAASSANIPEQQEGGDASGTMTVGGKVDQGSSANKGMRLDVALVSYSDGPVEQPDEDPVDITYDTVSPLFTELNMKGLPDAELTGGITGAVQMTGDLLGAVTLNLSLTGITEDDGSGNIRRAAGTVHVTGTATSEFGSYVVDVTR